MKFEKPTPIQAQAMPAIMSGRDVIGIAKTGSGKTLAYLLPMLRHILDQPPIQPGDGPIGKSTLTILVIAIFTSHNFFFLLDIHRLGDGTNQRIGNANPRRCQEVC